MTSTRFNRAMGAALFACLSVGAARAQTPSLTNPVHTPVGDIQGARGEGVAKFLGIPYAQPPVGDLRWQPPREAAGFNQVFAATKFAAFCAQPQRGVFASPSDNEDCLYLNIYAPDSKPSKGKRPVMVWFYGGGLFSGESDDYDGGKLARRGDVIVVTLNYRVGALGFLSNPAINAEGHAFANYGIMDQQLALKWVQKNISAFGGDPGNVTIFGQSGGGTSVMANLQSPLSKGLFHKAINESGTRVAVTTPATALKAGEDFAKTAGCEDQSAKCLRALSVKQVLDNQAPIVRYVADFPSVDGAVITRSAYGAFSAGDYNRVPVLTGLVQDEQGFFMAELNTHNPLTAEEYDRYAASFGADHKEKLLAKYPLADYPSPSLAEIAMAQGSKACTARLLDRAWSKYRPVYAYEFRDRSAPSYFPDVSYPMKAYHTSELQFLFPKFKGGQGVSHPLNAAQEKLSDDMVDYWTSFARAGVPRAKSGGSWPKYTPAGDNVKYLDLAGSKSANGYGAGNDCALWDGVLDFSK